jgi:hypothetical protein
MCKVSARGECHRTMQVLHAHEYHICHLRQLTPDRLQSCLFAAHGRFGQIKHLCVLWRRSAVKRSDCMCGSSKESTQKLIQPHIHAHPIQHKAVAQLCHVASGVRRSFVVHVRAADADVEQQQRFCKFCFFEVTGIVSVMLPQTTYPSNKWPCAPPVPEAARP